MGHIITFAQQKGGAGKTTILAHLAVAWAADQRSVAIADLDAQGSLSRWADLRGDPALVRIDTRDYRAAGDLRAAGRSHDVVLVDCPGAASSLLENVLRSSDLVIAPCQPSAMDVWASRSVIDGARAQGRPVRLLLNRVPPRLGGLEAVLEELGGERALLMETTLGNRVAFAQAVLNGRTAPELSRRSAAARETQALRCEIDGLLAAA